MKLNVTKKYGNNTVLDNLKFENEEGKITCIIGASGSGKTTLLNIISGLTGFEGSAEGVPGRISYIFQTDRLIPYLTVRGNIELVLKDGFPDKGERRARVDEVLKAVELDGQGDKYPRQLSGGMAQRAAMARAFVYPADLLLMDEPFRELDIGLKKRLTDMFRALWAEKKPSVVFVTHDADEALLLAHRICILDGGAIKDIMEGDGEGDLTSDASDEARKRIYAHFFDAPAI